MNDAMTGKGYNAVPDDVLDAPVDAFQEFAALDRASRVANVEAFMLGHLPDLKQMARKVALDGQDFNDEPLSSVMEATVKIYHRTDAELSGVRSFRGYIVQEAKRRQQESRRSSLPKGAKNVDRVSVEVNKTRDMLIRELGFPPTQDQLIERHNARMHQSRKDPARSGMILDHSRLREMEEISNTTKYAGVPVETHDGMVASQENLIVMQHLIAKVIRSCERLSPVLGQVAQMRLDTDMALGGDRWSDKEIAKRLELPVSSVEAMCVQVLQELVDELDEYARFEAGDDYITGNTDRRESDITHPPFGHSQVSRHPAQTVSTDLVGGIPDDPWDAYDDPPDFDPTP